MSKKMVSREKIQTELALLKSKGESNQLHLRELQSKKQRLEKSISDLEKKISQQKYRYEELSALLQNSSR